MRSKLLVAILAPFVAAATDAQLERNPASELVIADIATLAPTSIDRGYTEDGIVSLAAQAPASVRTDGDLGAWYVGRNFATLIKAIRLRPELLRIPEGPMRAGLGESPPLGHTHVSLEVEGRRHVLGVMEEFYDREYRLLHVTAVIVDQESSGYARFALDRESSIVAGTLNTNHGVYRVVQRPGADTQLVFKLAPGGAPDPHRYRNVVAPEGIAVQVARIEARHLQAEVLGDIQPFHFQASRTDLRADLFFNYAAAGTIDPKQVESSAQALELLARLGPLTGAWPGTALRFNRILGVRGGPEPFETEFVQVIDGVPVFATVRITLEAGSVSGIHSTLVNPALAPRPVVDTAARAADLAAAALSGEFGETMSSYAAPDEGALTRAGLTYRFDGPGALVPQWHLLLTPDSSASPRRRAIVNALTGEVAFPPPFRH
jgi:hypothetical protein